MLGCEVTRKETKKETKSEASAETNKTFDNFDQFGWRKFANRLTDFIQTESGFVKGSLVISLNAEFGRGKTTFFEMWENHLNGENNGYEMIRLNAWESDYINDPLLAIVFSVVEYLESEGGHSKVVQKIKKGVGVLVRAGASLGNDVIAHATGMNLIKAAWVATVKNLLGGKNRGEDLYKDFEDRTHALKDIRRALPEAFSKQESSRLIIAIDELDRCRPDYAISYLETIKHVFDIRQITFVIGVDKGALESVAKSLFGRDLKFEEYYRKFVHRNVSLPEPSEGAKKGFCAYMMDTYIRSEALVVQGRYSNTYHDGDWHNKHQEICDALDLSPRQIHEAYRIMAHMFVCEQEEEGKLPWGYMPITFFLIGLSFRERSLYERLGSGDATVEEIASFLNGKGFLVVDGCPDDCWFTILIAATQTRDNLDEANLPGIYKKFNLVSRLSHGGSDEEITREIRLEVLQISSDAFRRRSYRLPTPAMRMFEMIEEVMSFASR